MDKELLRKVQLAQLEIALEIKRVCDENNIRYFLDAGSLLGAVRHRGFIPWDDDMDFGMLAEEYNRFVRIAPEKLRKEYMLQTWDTDEGYPFVFSKVLKRGTEFVEDVLADSNKHNELYVDVFPYYPYPKDKKLRRKQKTGIQIYKHILMVQAKMKPWIRPKSLLGKAKVWLMYCPFILAAKIVDREKAKKKYLEVLDYSLYEKSDEYFEACDAKYGNWIVPAKCFDGHTELSFENHLFPAPIDYKTYLTSIYGDYMQLPPEDQRENHHNIIRVKL